MRLRKCAFPIFKKLFLGDHSWDFVDNQSSSSWNFGCFNQLTSLHLKSTFPGVSFNQSQKQSAKEIKTKKRRGDDKFYGFNNKLVREISSIISSRVFTRSVRSWGLHKKTYRYTLMWLIVTVKSKSTDEWLHCNN